MNGMQSNNLERGPGRLESEHVIGEERVGNGIAFADADCNALTYLFNNPGLADEKPGFCRDAYRKTGFLSPTRCIFLTIRG